jgi:hypothetical protein
MVYPLLTIARHNVDGFGRIAPGKQGPVVMDTYRGLDPFGSDGEDAIPAYAAFDDSPLPFDMEADACDEGIEAPPAIGSDERRMQVRAYNFWTGQLAQGNYPNIEELDPESVEDFRDHSVLLDFTSGIENPSIQYLGEALRRECGVDADIGYLDQVPPRSLLSRITDHYMQIIANRAPIGFEAEFVNERQVNIMYRGILLPYSSDDDTIDFIYGVINWKEAASAELAAALEAEVSEALAEVIPHRDPVPVWADGPTAQTPDFTPALDDGEEEDALELGAYAELSDAPGDEDGLERWLGSARECAAAAAVADVRSREALYRAIGRAYDFSLVAATQRDDYAELLTQNGLTAQERAPMTPVVKLVFGAGYDKTRLTEFAAALDYAHRNIVGRGQLADLISRQEGGLKAIVQAERRARKVEKGGHVAAPAAIDTRERLRVARARDLAEFASGSDEFVVLVARRDADGGVVLVGAMEDAALTERVLGKTLI